MTTIRRWAALIRWWCKMPVRSNYPTHGRSAEFHADTQKWLEQRP